MTQPQPQQRQVGEPYIEDGKCIVELPVLYLDGDDAAFVGVDAVALDKQVADWVRISAIETEQATGMTFAEFAKHFNRATP
jgi:hypothetical protein